MVLAALREALGLMARQPVFWLAGMTIGVLSALNMLMSLYIGSFYADKGLIVLALLVPFVLAGIYGVIQEPNDASFVRQGMRHYWKILLPALVLMFVWFATVVLIAVPLLLVGIQPSSGALAFSAIGIASSMVFFGFFYNTAAVFEERGVFDSLRRSIEFTILNSWKVVQFFAVCIIVAGSVFFAATSALTILLYDRLEPLVMLNETEIQQLMPADFIAMLGQEGVWIMAVVTMAALILLVVFIPTFQACFFRRYAGTQPPMIGEYDEKGRWYKY